MTTRLDEIADYFTDYEVIDIAEMYVKFGFAVNLEPTDIRPEILRARQRHLAEEVRELEEAIDADDMEKIVDALVDLVVIAKGAAVTMGLEWTAHWEEVMRANNEKRPGKNPGRDRDDDLIKPPGWVEPDHLHILQRPRSADVN